MGMQDRDYYQDEIYKRQAQRLDGREVEVHSWPPKNLPPPSPGWGATLLRTVLICLAVFGALSLLKHFVL